MKTPSNSRVYSFEVCVYQTRKRRMTHLMDVAAPSEHDARRVVVQEFLAKGWFIKSVKRTSEV